MFTRVRPPLERERHSYLPYADAVLIHPCGRTISLSENVSGASLNGAASVESGLVRLEFIALEFIALLACHCVMTLQDLADIPRHCGPLHLVI